MDALLNKHFGTNWVDLEHDISWGDYICMYATALDMEEREHYREYLLAGGDTKKWRWSSPDRAGTQHHTPTDILFTMAKGAGALDPGRRGSAEEFARATGRQIAYKDPSGIIRDISGKTVEYHSDMFLLPESARKPEIN